MTWTLHEGDCLEIMPQIKEKIDAVIADPPYMINTKSDGMGKINPWTDYCNAALWYGTWMAAAKKLLKPTGCLWTFLNWRSMVTFQKAACDIRWPIESILVWDKCWIGPGGDKGLRPSYEMVALFAMPEFAIPDRSIADVQRFKWSAHKPNGHPAEKPESLIRFLIEISTPIGGTVIDPFAGSGTTGAAAEELQRNSVLIEQDPAWCEVIRNRLGSLQQTIFQGVTR